MSDSSTSYHESPEALPPELRDRHRALASLREELEAVDWYDQRVAACSDSELRAILEHNRDEEKEHAAMLIAWLRKHDATFDQELEHPRTPGREPNPAAEREHAAGRDDQEGSLRIGSLKEHRS
ncbi:MAG TPA: encapsulin-associated ferritin-like protein [Polyangiales bacterium]|jgi:hypothetical protein|nr:encapsulin-associated ferritin-like protein [Polyangiales bacterium]